jgi:predicted transcriptional regulator
MQFLEVIEKVAGKSAPGRTPAFTEAHILKALETLGAGKPIGRKRLSEILGLGEGETRTLVKHLRNEDVIKVSRTGVVLSRLGKKLLFELKTKIRKEIEIPESSLTVGPHNIAVLIKKAADSVKYGLEQRDAALKAGAIGATTLVFKNDRLAMPGVNEDVFANIRSIHDLLIAKLRPEEDDVIIIGSGANKRIAEFAAKTAAFKLLGLKSR